MKYRALALPFLCMSALSSGMPSLYCFVDKGMRQTGTDFEVVCADEV